MFSLWYGMGDPALAAGVDWMFFQGAFPDILCNLMIPKEEQRQPVKLSENTDNGIIDLLHYRNEIKKISKLEKSIPNINSFPNLKMNILNTCQDNKLLYKLIVFPSEKQFAEKFHFIKRQLT